MGISLPWRDSHTEFNCDVSILEVFIARANENAIKGSEQLGKSHTVSKLGLLKKEHPGKLK